MHLFSDQLTGVRGARPHAHEQRVSITLDRPAGHTHAEDRAALAAPGPTDLFCFNPEVAATGTSPESWVLRIQDGLTHAVWPSLCWPYPCHGHGHHHPEWKMLLSYRMKRMEVLSSLQGSVQTRTEDLILTPRTPENPSLIQTQWGLLMPLQAWPPGERKQQGKQPQTSEKRATKHF